MIDVTIFFEKEDMPNVLSSFLDLPEAIKPILFSDRDDRFNSENQISNKQKFDEFIEGNKLGFFMKSEICLYSVNYHSVDYQSVNLWIPEELQIFIHGIFESIAKHNPVFGYAADVREFEHRNRIFHTLGENNIEAWVGRDIDRYIPGLYCYTLLSNQLLNKHKVNFLLIQDSIVSISHLGEDTLHLIQYFDNTEDWEENVSNLDGLCESTQGIFSIKEVEKSVVGKNKFTDFTEAIRDWK